MVQAIMYDIGCPKSAVEIWVDFLSGFRKKNEFYKENSADSINQVGALGCLGLSATIMGSAFQTVEHGLGAGAKFGLRTGAAVVTASAVSFGLRLANDVIREGKIRRVTNALFSQGP